MLADAETGSAGQEISLPSSLPLGTPLGRTELSCEFGGRSRGSYSVDAGASTSLNLSARHLRLEMLIVSASRSRETNSGRVTTITIIPEHNGIR